MHPHRAVLPPLIAYRSHTLSEQERTDALNSATDCGSSPASSAFAAFNALTTACGRAQDVINGVSFGPYPIKGSCTVDCRTKKFEWAWDPNFNSWAPFSSALSNMNIEGAFSKAFNPAKSFVGALPTATADLTKAIDDILMIDSEIEKEGGKATPAQEKALSAAFAAALSTVQNSLTACTGALQTMSSFVSSQQSKTGYLQNYSKQVQSNIDGCVKRWMEDVLGSAPCGAGDITNKFNGIKNDVSNSISELSTPFSQVNAAFVDAITAASCVAGTLLAVQSEYATVSGPINDAKGLDPASPVRMLKLDIAKNAWAQLVAQAQASLSAMSSAG